MLKKTRFCYFHLKSRGRSLILFSLNADLVTSTSAEQLLIYSGISKRQVRMMKLSGGTLIKCTLGEVSMGPSSPSRHMTTRVSHSFSCYAGRLPSDNLNYVEFACSSPFLEQFIAPLIGGKKVIATKTQKEKAQAYWNQWEFCHPVCWSQDFMHCLILLILKK